MHERVSGILLLFISLCLQSIHCPKAQAMPSRQALTQSQRRQQTAIAQNKQDVATLEIGNPHSRELAGGQKHEYQIALLQNQYLEITIAERGIEVTLSVTKPDGSLLMEFDAPSAEDTAQPIPIIAETSGHYFLVVQPAEPNAAAGRYEISVKEVHTATETDRSQAEAFLLNAQGKKLLAAGKYDEAIAAEEKSLAILEKTNAAGNAEIADALNGIGLIYSEKGDYKKAEQFFNRALEIYEKVFGEDHFFVAAVFNNLAANYRALGEFEKAEASYQRALTIDEEKFGADNLKVGTILGNLAYLYYVKGDYSKAEEPYNRSLAISEKHLGAESFDAAVTLNNLALLYRVRGDYAKAISFFQRAEAIAEKTLGADHPSVAKMLSNLATCYSDNGDYETAEQILKRVLAVREKTFGAESPDYASALNNLGTLYVNKRDYERAESFFQRALVIREKKLGSEHPLVAETLSNLADVYRTRSELGKVEPLLRRALEIIEKKFGKENASAAPILLNLGSLYFQTGDYKQAETFFQSSLATFEKSNGAAHPFTARPLASLAMLYAAKGDLAQALAFQEKYLAIRERNLELNLYIGSERQKFAYMESLSQDLSSAISLQTQFMPLSEESKQMALQLLLNRKGRTLDATGNSVFTLRRRALPDDRKLIDRLSDARTRLANLTLKGVSTAEPKQYQGQLKTLEKEKEKLEDEVSRRSAEFRAQAQPATLSAVRALLPDDAALLEFIAYKPLLPKAVTRAEQHGEPRYVVYVIRSHGDVQWRDLGTVKELDGAVDAWRQALREPERRDVRRLARIVDEKVMQPVRVLAGNATHLLVSPDGELNLMPFAALVDESGHYLIERYAFTYLTSGRDLLHMGVARQSKSNPVIIANPAFGESVISGQIASNTTVRSSLAKGARRRSVIDARSLSGVYFAPLDGTTQEARGIKTLFTDATLLTGEGATEAALKTVVAPDILHIATHGFFLQDTRTTPAADALAANRSGNGESSAQIENPLLRSGLALAGANSRNGGGSDDGILTALEASGLNLWGTKLVVLSACDTGLGEVRNGEGVYGLRRAFVLAGTESLVMSLWPVSDYSTRRLMTDYYKNLKGGLGRGAALRRVQLDMLKRDQTLHPFYWANFIQSGEWANLDGRR
jgi:CHAT domain-containing protein/Flp pilus assembly protein TadD